MRPALPAAMVAILGCSKSRESGEEWAKKWFGADAVKLKSLSGGPPMGGEGEPYAPRPLVVLDWTSHGPGDTEGPAEFHAINAVLPAEMVAHAANEVQTIVAVKRVVREENLRTFRIKRRTAYAWDNKPVQLITVLVRNSDGRFRAVGGDVVQGHDEEKLVAYLHALPTAPVDK